MSNGNVNVDVSARKPWAEVLGASRLAANQKAALDTPYSLSDDGHLVKTVLMAAPIEAAVPPPLSRVSVYMRVCDESQQLLFESVHEEVEFVIGRAETARGVEMVCATMQVGEKARIHCGPELGWSIARYRPSSIPADRPLIFEVELIRFEPDAKPWEMSLDDKKLFCGRKRDLGNQLHKTQKYKSAKKQYQQGLDALVGIVAGSAEGVKCYELITPLRLNIASCALKTNEWTEAVEQCGHVLDYDKSNVKALYRRAQGHVALSNFEEASTDLNRILDMTELDADTREAAEAELKRCQDAKKRLESRQRAQYAGAFDKPATVEPVVPKRVSFCQSLCSKLNWFSAKQKSE